MGIGTLQEKSVTAHAGAAYDCTQRASRSIGGGLDDAKLLQRYNKRLGRQMDPKGPEIRNEPYPSHSAAPDALGGPADPGPDAAGFGLRANTAGGAGNHAQAAARSVALGHVHGGRHRGQSGDGGLS